MLYSHSNPPMPAKQKIERLQHAASSPRQEGVGRIAHFLLTKQFDGAKVRLATPELDGTILAGYHSACKKAGLAPKELLIVESLIPNAMCMMNGKMAISTGLAKLLNHEEMEAVFAHELGHRKHWFKHMALPMLVGLGAAIGTFVGLSKLDTYIRSHFGAALPAAGASRTHKIVYTLGSLSVASLASRLTGGWLAASSSKGNELEADDASATITHNPKALASALQKLEKYVLELKHGKLEVELAMVERKQKNFAHVHIPPPDAAEKEFMHKHGLKLEERSRKAAARGTHPTTEERIHRLGVDRKPPPNYVERTQHADKIPQAAFRA